MLCTSYHFVHKNCTNYNLYFDFVQKVPVQICTKNDENSLITCTKIYNMDFGGKKIIDNH